MDKPKLNGMVPADYGRVVSGQEAYAAALDETRVDQVAGAISRHINSNLDQGEVLAAARYIAQKYARGHDAPATDPRVQVQSYAVGDMTVGRVEQRDGSHLWAVHRSGECLSTSGEWGWEPSPSSRTSEWLSAHRFQSADEAINAAMAAAEEQA